MMTVVDGVASDNVIIRDFTFMENYILVYDSPHLMMI